MLRMELTQILESEREPNFDTAKFILYHWNPATKTGEQALFPGRAAVLDPTLTAICNVEPLVYGPILDARHLARLVYLAAKETGKFPESIDDFSRYIIRPNKISSRINKKIIACQDATPYKQSEIDDITARAFAQLTGRNVGSFEFLDEQTASFYPKWNRACGYSFYFNSYENRPVPIYLLFHVDNHFCRVVSIDKASSQEMHHFEIYGSKNIVIETLTGRGSESAKVRNKYLIGQQVRPEELMHPSDLPDFNEILSNPLRKFFRPYSAETIRWYRNVLKFVNADK